MTVSLATSRTGTGKWVRVRNERRRLDFEAGLTQCPECGVHMDWEYSRRPNSAEVDHIIPHSRGGRDILENTRTCCRLCNQKLGGKVGRTKSGQPTRRTAAGWFDTVTKW